MRTGAVLCCGWRCGTATGRTVFSGRRHQALRVAHQSRTDILSLHPHLTKCLCRRTVLLHAADNDLGITRIPLLEIDFGRFQKRILFASRLSFRMSQFGRIAKRQLCILGFSLALKAQSFTVRGPSGRRICRLFHSQSVGGVQHRRASPQYKQASAAIRATFSAFFMSHSKIFRRHQPYNRHPRPLTCQLIDLRRVF